ncbi:MAG: ScpA family protein [Alphaproteobacteria bacterium]|nr:ScpA family protein [Alphaproteobacteria bacterium]
MSHDPFEQPARDGQFAGPELSSSDGPVQLVLNLDGYEGPIDLLLSLARDQKVDLTRISILQLAEQYLAYVQEARRLRLEVAADYLVVAAWLAYLKSRLLLPAEELEETEPTGDELAAALAFQLRRLDAMREAGARLFARPLLGRDLFANGAPEGLRMVNRPMWDASLAELLRAYGSTQRRGRAETLHIEPPELYSVDDAMARLLGYLGQVPNWTILMSFLPDALTNDLLRRSAVASTFVAGLELARTGQLELRQEQQFGPIYVRRGGERGGQAVPEIDPDTNSGNRP